MQHPSAAQATSQPSTPIVAITGGIGSGKSYVCRLLGERGIDVYDCDTAAKRLMATSDSLKQALRQLVGPEVYADGTLQKRVLATFLLESEANKQAVNDVIHPAVAHDFMHSSYHWLESAILFESGFDRRVAFDHIIAVAAPLDVRLKRVMERDHISREQALRWINTQWPQDEVTAHCHHIIYNDGTQPLGGQIDKLLQQLTPTPPINA